MARQGFIGKLIYEDLFRQHHDMAFSKHKKQV